MKFLRSRLLISTAILATLAVSAKYGADMLGWEFISLNPLFTSIIGGGIFVLSILLSGTIADYKESDKIPADMGGALASIFEEGHYIKQTHPDFDLDGLRHKLHAIIGAFPLEYSPQRALKSYEAVDALSSSYAEMERLGVPPNYIVRLKQDQSLIRRHLMRINHIQRTKFLPSANRLGQTIATLIVVMLVFAQIDPLTNGLVLTGFVSYIFIFLIKLLHVAETPFRERGASRDDVSLFLLRQLDERMAKTGH